MDEYYEFRNLLQLPKEDMLSICNSRVFQPEKFDSYQGAPSERLIKSKLNPEKSNNTLV